MQHQSCNMIPFSPPRIDQAIIDEVVDTLQSGWITTGPKTKKFEKEITRYSGCQATLCLNSATAGLELMLRWLGVKAGDEVIIPAYTYAATANVVMHCGARPVLVDVDSNFNLDILKAGQAITEKTKVIMPVDFGGLPCDYDSLNALVKRDDVSIKFKAGNSVQQQFGRIMILADAAHSLGATYKGRKTGTLADITVFSFHAVKNLTTAEGGAVALNLPRPFDPSSVYDFLCMYSLHGQNKDALSKMQKGSWKYDIVEAGYKCNMTDLAASLGLVELRRYDEDTLQRRKKICQRYTEVLSKKPWALCPVFKTGDGTESSYHLYPLRIRGVDESMRDRIIHAIFEKDVSVNVHFIPLPLHSYYRNAGYNILDYPAAYAHYACEISLPVYYDLTESQVETVLDAVIRSVEELIGDNQAG